MPAYRLYFVDRDAHISRPPKILDCADDAEALQKAKQFIDGKDLELWEGTRRVALIPHLDEVPPES